MKDIFSILMFTSVKTTMISPFRLKEWKSKNLNQALKCRLVLKIVHKSIKVNQKAWLKSHIDMRLEKKQQMILKKVFIIW